MLAFSKYHGLGNDFIIIDRRQPVPSGTQHCELPLRWESIASALCNRNLGIGADGVLLLHAPTSPSAIATMQIINADGSEAEMCGNGIRCVAKYLGLSAHAKSPYTVAIDTRAGLLTCSGNREGDELGQITVTMGGPRMRRHAIPMRGNENDLCLRAEYILNGRSLQVTALSMGNPHAVVFVPEHRAKLLELTRDLGPGLGTHSDFPDGCNASFAHVHSPTDIEVVVWERGCGITRACGTGACATAVAACKSGYTDVDSQIGVTLPGGTLTITVAHDYSYVLMTGPAQHVFDGTIDVPLTHRTT